ncbi:MULTISPECIES: hypothetical protein [Leptospira]|uniref:hypothetical protein n=1 Tax=Leptospira TaxID=171 RepID=UPI0002F5058C|nr:MULTISPECIES: hypothetical protein [Leptospira]AXX15835.1 hypothetical protein C4Q31_10030 [Leptospira borgpetersenii serovar Ceylonica]MDQ7244041.1 hypothetical protein [Leptospira borgpetersenii]PTM49999.1 hypothetical protein CLV95_10181 [Leptospira borgpetersenii serovar Javanica]QVK48835.1 hypothetical protein FH601_05920 [Leptospira borgpetersenii]QVK49796.1 hypothetical protein FH600_08325 [Leptospira borgpetersenii]
MNVTGITIQSFSLPQFSKEAEPGTQLQEKDAKISESISRTKPKSTVNEIKPEELVMKPSPISLEERMNQVISPEQMKNLLSMMVRSRMSENPADHKIDVKR